MTDDFGGFREVKHLSITFSLYRFEFHKKASFFTVLYLSNFVFRRFKNGDFSVEDKPRCGQSKKFEDKEL